MTFARDCIHLAFRSLVSADDELPLQVSKISVGSTTYPLR